MDKRLFDFDNLRATGVASGDGDIGFDVDPDLEAAVEAAAADAPNVIKLARG
jgi:hypothetical protein